MGQEVMVKQLRLVGDFGRGLLCTKDERGGDCKTGGMVMREEIVRGNGNEGGDCKGEW